MSQGGPGSGAAGVFQPCPHCRADVPRYKRGCPRCGGLLPAAAGAASRPAGWVIEALPDGTERLQEAPRRRLARGLIAAAIVALLAHHAFLRFVLAESMHRGDTGAAAGQVSFVFLLIWALVLAFVLSGGVAFLLFALFGRIELRVGPDYLEVRRRLLGREWVSVFRNGRLSVEPDLCPGRFFRSLWEWQHGGCLLRLYSGAPPETLWSSSLLHLTELHLLARYLAQRTGWGLSGAGRFYP